MTDTSMERLRALDAFIKAAEKRSFTAAGRALSITSSAVGKAVTRLEKNLGVRLFHRTTRAITLTKEGELFLARCLRIMVPNPMNQKRHIAEPSYWHSVKSKTTCRPCGS